MRRGNGGGIVRTDDGALLGVMLGSDFCAEHEWGIKRLRQIYGINESAEGIERRRIQVAPTDRILTGTVQLTTHDYAKPRAKRREQSWWGLVSARYPLEDGDAFGKETIVRCELHPLGAQDMCGAWDDGSFGFLTLDKGVVDEIRSSIASCDLCIGLFNNGPVNPFSRAGLGLLIASRVPQSVRDMWLQSDRDERRLTEVAAATGIAARLKASGREYFALSPRWADEEKTSVRFWLNPRQQDKHNYGWFTVEELDQWAAGKGPVMKGESA